MIRDAMFLSGEIIKWRQKRRAAGIVWRPFLVGPLRTGDERIGKHLVDAVRGGAGVPMVYVRRANPVANFFRWLRFCVVLQDKTRKSAFEIVRWSHFPADHLAPEAANTGSAGSVLLVELAQSERRDHFKRSVKAGATASRRPIVLATVRDLCDATAWVRVIFVNGLRPVMDTQSQTRVALGSSTAVDSGTSAWSRIRQKDVPPDAIWLICDSGSQLPPAADWGSEPESFDASPRPPRSGHTEEYLKDEASSWRNSKAALWLVLGLELAAIPFALAVGVFDGGVSRGLLAFSISWLAVAVLLLVWGVWFAVSSAFVESWWDRCMIPDIGEEATSAIWTGGTARGVFLGRLLHQVSYSRQWQKSRRWAVTWLSRARTGDLRALVGQGRSQGQQIGRSSVSARQPPR